MVDYLVRQLSVLITYFIFPKKLFQQIDLHIPSFLADFILLELECSLGILPRFRGNLRLPVFDPVPLLIPSNQLSASFRVSAEQSHISLEGTFPPPISDIGDNDVLFLFLCLLLSPEELGGGWWKLGMSQTSVWESSRGFFLLQEMDPLRAHQLFSGSVKGNWSFFHRPLPIFPVNVGLVYRLSVFWWNKILWVAWCIAKCFGQVNFELLLLFDCPLFLEQILQFFKLFCCYTEMPLNKFTNLVNGKNSLSQTLSSWYQTRSETNCNEHHRPQWKLWFLTMWHSQTLSHLTQLIETVTMVMRSRSYSWVANMSIFISMHVCVCLCV